MLQRKFGRKKNILRQMLGEKTSSVSYFPRSVGEEEVNRDVESGQITLSVAVTSMCHVE